MRSSRLAPKDAKKIAHDEKLGLQGRAKDRENSSKRQRAKENAKETHTNEQRNKKRAKTKQEQENPRRFGQIAPREARTPDLEVNSLTL